VFEFLGMSEPISVDDSWQQLVHTPRDGRAVMYIHSIIAYDGGIAEVALHVNDRWNFRARLFGVEYALRAIHERNRHDTIPADFSEHLGPRKAALATQTCRVNLTKTGQGRAAKIGLVTDFVLADETGRLPTWLERSTASKACYAAQHSYAFEARLRANYTAMESAFIIPSLMQKTQAIRDQLHGGLDWVIWMDYDALIMNGSVSLNPLVRNARDFDVIVGDGGDQVNAGIFAVRKSAGGMAFFEGIRTGRHSGGAPWRPPSMA